MKSREALQSTEMEPVYQVTRKTAIYLAVFVLACFVFNLILFIVSINRTATIRNELRAEMNSNISQQISAVDVNRREATFTFQLNDVTDFLNSRKSRGSEFFYCGGMRFFLNLRNKQIDWEDYLDVSLVRFNPSDNYTYFMKTEFELRLINVRRRADLVVQAKYTFAKDKPEAHGKEDFVKTWELKYFSSDYVWMDSLKVQVHLQCDPIRRIL